MNSDLDFYSDPQNRNDSGSDDEDEPLSDRAYTEHIEDVKYLLNETLNEMTAVSTALAQHVEENRQLLQELRAEVLSHGTVLLHLLEQSKAGKEKLNQIAQQTKELPDPTTVLAEPLKQIQEQQRILIKSRRRQSTEAPAPGPASFSRKAIAVLLAAQGVLVAFATVFLIHQVPPRATAKAEQQWYSIFQRVDRLYKDKYENKPLK